tara:strand:- start:1711 stop:1989 length:279 start_codon:yes stop_codon:yes gene_type:complete
MLKFSRNKNFLKLFYEFQNWTFLKCPFLYIEIFFIKKNPKNRKFHIQSIYDKEKQKNKKKQKKFKKNSSLGIFFCYPPMITKKCQKMPEYDF